MAGTSALGGLASGIVAGQEHMDKRRRNKAIDNMLAQDSYEKDLDFAARKNDYAEASDGDMSGWKDFSNPEEKDPYAVRGFNWLKSKFGFGSQDNATAGLTQPVAPTQDENAIPAIGEGPDVPTFGGRTVEELGAEGREKQYGYADGGRVRDDGIPALFDEEGNRRELTDEEVTQRSYGKYYVTEGEAADNRAARSRGEHRNRNPYHGRYGAGVNRQAIYNDNTGGGVSEALQDVKHSAVNSNTGRAIANLGPNAEASVGLIKDANGPEQTGRAVRGSMQDAGQGALNVAGGAATDVVEGLGLDSVVGFVRGFVGNGGTRDNRQPDPNTPPKAMSGKGDTPKAQAINAAVGGEEPATTTAKKAVNAAVEMTPGHPDNPDQTFDWSEVSASGVTPEDIPNATVKDWERYRKSRARSAALRGESQEEVQMDITKMQMQGFASNAQQAAFLLRQGDARGAALAMRGAYQYLPNGSDVRFGIAEGANGPVLVGMGVDEETGEAVGESEQPMLLTPEVISVYVEQVSNPAAFRTWTKDWHEMAQKDRQYNEIDKPTAQADINLKGAQTRRADAAAAKDNAYVNDPRSREGGLKQSDYDRGYAAFLKDQELTSLEDPARARYLADIMARIYQRNPDTPYPSIINLVMTSEEAGTLEEDIAEIGLR